MKIVACVKAVPSTTEVKMDPKTNTIVRDGKQSVINPFDTAALELGIQLKERLGGTLCAISMGIPDTVRLLRDAVSRGADDALLLSDRAFAGADTLATSYALSLGIERLAGDAAASERPAGDIDLVLCGRMAVDGDTAQIGSELAGIFGMPCVTAVTELMEADEAHVVVRHETDEGTATVDVPLPAVLTVSKDIATLRMPSISGVRAGEAAEVCVLNAEQAGADLTRCGLNGSPTQVVRSFVPEHGSGAGEVAGSSDEQADALMAIFEEAVR